MRHISVLPSVYSNQNGYYKEYNLYWCDLLESGRILYIQNEMKSFIKNDFKSDRFHISYFLDKYKLWEKFEYAKRSINVIPLIYGGSDSTNISISNITDWFDDSPLFTFEIFSSLIDSLNLRSEFHLFMLNECQNLENERFECGYPLIVPDNIQYELLVHIKRKTV